MTKAAQTVEEAYAKIVRHFSTDKGVAVGSEGKKGFGSTALRTKKKIFAMVSSKGAFVVKLPKARVDALVAAKAGKPFSTGSGRIMKEWIELNPAGQDLWLGLTEEAKEFVAKGG